MDYKFLEEIMLRWSESELRKEDGVWIACTEWLVGTFAGRSFEGKTKHQALSRMCEYFDRMCGTLSMVGETLERMRWPDLAAIYQKLFVEGE